MGLGWDVSDAWRVSVDGSVARRIVRERDIEVAGEGALVWGGARRRDTWGRTSVRVEHLGERTLVRVGPAVEWNRSSSFGRGYTRTGLSADLTALVWGDLRAHAATRIEWALFVDPALVDEGLLLDDENRNRFLVTLDHPLVGELQVEVRWELHASSVAGACCSSPLSV
jgi:hypothetical protein